jgi:hypothetical protein
MGYDDKIEWDALNDEQQSAYLVLSAKETLRITQNYEECINLEINKLKRKLKETRNKRREDYNEFRRRNDKYCYPLSKLSENERKQVEELVTKDYARWYVERFNHF